MPTYRPRTGLPRVRPARTRRSAPTARIRCLPRDVKPELYGYGRMSTAHLYTVPVLSGFDAVRNCSHCRRSTDDDCAAWRKLRKAVAVLRQECRRYAKGVDELMDATGDRTTTVYEFADGSMAYFAPDAPDFREAGELKGDDLDAAQRVLTVCDNRVIGGHCDVGADEWL